MKTLKFKLYQHKRNRHLKRSINAAGVIYNHALPSIAVLPDVG
jgi:putative transposase